MNTYEISQIIQNAKSLPELIGKPRENNVEPDVASKDIDALVSKF